MSEPVTIDEKGRLVLPKRVRLKAGITPPSTLLAEAKGQGVVELRDSTALLDRVRGVAAKKLTGWREEEHKEDKMILESARRAPRATD